MKSNWRAGRRCFHAQPSLTDCSTAKEPERRPLPRSPLRTPLYIFPRQLDRAAEHPFTPAASFRLSRTTTPATLEAPLAHEPKWNRVEPKPSRSCRVACRLLGPCRLAVGGGRRPRLSRLAGRRPACPDCPGGRGPPPLAARPRPAPPPRPPELAQAAPCRLLCDADCSACLRTEPSPLRLLPPISRVLEICVCTISRRVPTHSWQGRQTGHGAL